MSRKKEDHDQGKESSLYPNDLVNESPLKLEKNGPKDGGDYWKFLGKAMHMYVLIKNPGCGIR